MSIFPSIPRKLSSFITAQLYLALPPPHDDTPETLEARDLAAMAAVTRLGPANTAEAFLAVQAIASQQHASDALQGVAKYRSDFKVVGQCRAQSATMMRQAATALKELRILQETRLTLLAQHQAEADAAEVQTDDGVPDTPYPSPGLANFAEAWMNEVRKRRSHGTGLRFTKRDIETDPDSPSAAPVEGLEMAPIALRMAAGYVPAHPG